METSVMRSVMALAAVCWATQAANAQSRLATLLRADREAAARSGTHGLAFGLEPALGDDAVLVFPNIPVLRGRPQVLAFLATLAPAWGRVQWDPVFLEPSRDSSFAVMYGTTATVGRPDTAASPGRFISAWRADASGRWHIVALSLTLTTPPDLPVPDAPALAPADRNDPFAHADYAFADSAVHGVAGAFGMFAAADAAVYGGRVQPYIRGPEAIRNALAGADNNALWQWRPVAAGGDAAGSLGFTVGETVLRDSTQAGPTLVTYGHYMTLWRRGADGSVRYIADGGSARPAPAGSQSPDTTVRHP